MSKIAELIRVTNTKGYSVLEDGRVINPKGSFRKLKIATLAGLPYLSFSMRVDRTSVRQILVHKLAAYQLFGEAALAPGVVVRHLDGNSLNNSLHNLAIGTQSDNLMDRTPEARLAHAISTASHKRVLTDSQIAEARVKRAAGATYSQLMKEYSLAKSTIRHILLNDYKTSRSD